MHVLSFRAYGAVISFRDGAGDRDLQTETMPINRNVMRLTECSLSIYCWALRNATIPPNQDTTAIYCPAFMKLEFYWSLPDRAYPSRLWVPPPEEPLQEPSQHCADEEVWQASFVCEVVTGDDHWDFQTNHWHYLENTLLLIAIVQHQHIRRGRKGGYVPLNITGRMKL